jgi:hypothetical protein
LHQKKTEEGEKNSFLPPLNSSEEAPRGKTKERNWTERALRCVKKEDGAVTLSLVSSGSFFLSLFARWLFLLFNFSHLTSLSLSPHQK